MSMNVAELKDVLKKNKIPIGRNLTKDALQDKVNKLINKKSPKPPFSVKRISP